MGVAQSTSGQPGTYRAKFDSDPDFPWRILDDTASPKVNGKMTYDAFPASALMYMAYCEKALGYSSLECLGTLFLAEINHTEYSTPYFKAARYQGEAFVPGKSPASALAYTLQQLGVLISKARTRFVFVFVALTFYSTRDNYNSKIASGGHATGILFDRENKLALTLDPLNHGGYSKKEIRDLALQEKARCAYLHLTFRMGRVGMADWSFNSIAMELGSALWYVEGQRPKAGDRGYCVPLLFYHVLALAYYLPFLDTVLGPSTNGAEDWGETSPRFKAITSVVIHTMCHPLPPMYPPPLSYLLRLFGLDGEEEISREKVSGAIAASWEEQTNALTMYNVVCHIDQQGWVNLSEFFYEVQVKYFGDALERAKLPPMYLWRQGSRAKQGAEGDGLFYIDDGNGAISCELLGFERHRNDQLWKKRAFTLLSKAGQRYALMREEQEEEANAKRVRTGDRR